MTKISIFELEKLRNHVSVREDCRGIWEKLLKIGEENIKEEGVELINKIKLLRGVSDDDICEMCEIRRNDFALAMTKGKFSLKLQEKLRKII